MLCFLSTRCFTDDTFKIRAATQKSSDLRQYENVQKHEQEIPTNSTEKRNLRQERHRRNKQEVEKFPHFAKAMIRQKGLCV